MIDYQDILLCYGIKSGRTSYYDEDLLGGSLIILNNDQTFFVERLFDSINYAFAYHKKKG